jgi:branched-chain amino acid aminotransferase
MNFINYNGKILDENEPIVAAQNRGLRYGDGIFETMKLKNGRLILSDEHFARLWKGMQMLQFDIPKLLSPEKF